MVWCASKNFFSKIPIGSPAGTTAQAASGALSVTVTVSGPVAVMLFSVVGKL